MTEDPQLFAAARALAAAGLVDAFGHVSVRAGDVLRLTPPKPLSTLCDSDCSVAVGVDADSLPAQAPKEAWIHLSIYRSRPDVSAICRAQPPSVAAAAAGQVPIRALHGQGAFLGPVVPVFDDARLVRTRELGLALADAMADAPALVMRGNGAVTVAKTPGRAVALMAVLEYSARLNLAATAAAASAVHALSDDELRAWQRASDEVLDRFWAHLHDRSQRADPAP